MVIQMTRAEYEAKYGTPPPVPPKQQFVPPPKTPTSNKIANFLGAKGITEQFGASLARAKAPKAEKSFVEFPKPKEVVGSAIQFGANFLPGAGVGAGLGTKVAVGAGTGLAFDVGSKLQVGKPIQEAFKPGIATAVGASIPVIGAAIKPATRIIGRLVKGLGSGLSGVSTKTIDKIVTNPQTAQRASEAIQKSGNAKVLEENAKTVMRGVSTIKKEARKAFGEGLESLAEADINPTLFRKGTQTLLDKYGIRTTEKGAKLANFEFNDPKNLTKANELLKRLNTVKLDGKSLRKLADDVEASAYKIATGDERLSFNAFVKDLSNTLKKTVSEATPKFGEINKKFSTDIQLAETIEDIFGKVKFGNLRETVRASKRLEGLFAQTGIAPEVIDDFLNRIGLSPEDFKTTEAVRQITNKITGTNPKGLNFAELTRELTSAIVTPQTVRDIAIKIGVAEQTLLPELRKLSSPVRKALLNFLVQNRE